MSVHDIFEPNKIVFEVTDTLRNRIIELERLNNIPAGYLKTALALHIPRFSESEIYSEGNIEFQNMYLEAKRLAVHLRSNIESLPEDFQKSLLVLDKYSKVKNGNGPITEVDINGKENEVIFKEVDPEIGTLIQEKLHYIGQAREDTKYHFGFYRKGEKYPFAYSAYSVLDRRYLLGALPFQSNMNNILVLTRSFSINSSPINSMSLLFSSGIHKIREESGEYSAIITAINPNTLFKGTVFKGSTFFTFATVPFIPSYYEGNYITRKKLAEMPDFRPNELKGAKIDCKPTIWMGNGFNKQTSLQFQNAKIESISKNTYLQG